MFARVIRPIPAGAGTVIPISPDPIDVSGWANADSLIKLRYLEPVTIPMTAAMMAIQVKDTSFDHVEPSVPAAQKESEPVPDAPNKNKWSANKAERKAVQKSPADK